MEQTKLRNPEVQLVVRLLGVASLNSNGREHALERKGAGALAYLALQGPTPRGVLATLLWPDVGEAAARRNLRQCFFRLRPLAGFDLIAGKQILSPDPRIQIDIAADTVDIGSPAVELLAGCDFSDCPDFAEWLSGARQRFHERHRAALQSAAVAHEEAGELALAIALTQRLIEADPLTELSHRRLMRLHYLRGDRAAALAAFERCEQTLKHELGVRPDAETLALLGTIEAAEQAVRVSPRAELPISVLRPPRLIGREAELAAIKEGWTAGQVVLVTGEAGAGKSRLIEAAVADHSTNIVRSRTGDRSTPYALLARLLRSVIEGIAKPLSPRVRTELARLLPEMGQSAPMRDRSDQARFMQAVEAALISAVGDGLECIAIDDLHCADEASGDALAILAAGDLKLKWLLAARAEELNTGPSAPLLGLPRTIVALPPLSESEIGELLQTLNLLQLESGTILEPLARHAGGNPMFVLETIKQMLIGNAPNLDQGGPSVLPVPERVKNIIERRFERISAPAIRLMRCAALAEQDFDAALAAAVLGSRPIDLADAWSELEAQQILRGNFFAHDLVAAAALKSVPGPVSAAIHSEIARFLECRAGDPGRIAQHFASAGEDAAAVPHWLAAGGAAQAALRYGEAARFYELSARAALANGLRETAFEAAKLMRAAAFEIDLSEMSESALGLLELSADTAAEKAFALSERAVTHLHRGDLDSTQHFAREGLKVLGDEAAPLVRIELRRNLAAVHTYRNETFAALAELRSVQHEVDILAQPELKFQFLQSLAIICDHADQWDEAQRGYEAAIQLGLSTGNIPGAAQTCLNFVVGLLERGHVRRALLGLERARTLIATMPAGSSSYSSMDLNHGIVLRMSGDYAGALQHIDRAVQVGAAQTPGWLPLIRANQAHVWLHLGQVGRARQALQAAVPDNTTPVVALAKWHDVQCDVESALGRSAPSLEAIIGRLPVEGRRVTRWRLLVKSVVHDVDPHRAWRQGRALLSEVRSVGQFALMIHLGARLAAMSASVGEAETGAELARHVLEALREHEPDDITRAHALALCARALDAAGDRSADLVTTSAVRWLQDTASSTVPSEFRESFRLRHAPHRLLLEAASRQLPAA